MIKSILKKISLCMVVILLIYVSYGIYQSNHITKIKALFHTITADSINVTLSTSVQNSDYYLTDEEEVNKFMEQLNKASWNYHGKKLNSGYNFSQTISCHLYSDIPKPVTINFLKQKLKVYVTIRGEEDYGVYTLSLAEGQEIIDMLLTLNDSE